MKPPKTLAEMASEASGSQPMQIAGKPADVCPYCGAGMIADGGTRAGASDTFRYVTCRNESCRKRFYTRHPKPQPGTIVREIDEDDISSKIGRPALTLVRESA